MSDSDQDEIMSRSELKALLNVAKRNSVGCAIGVTKDKEAVVLLSKTKTPKALEAELKKTLELGSSRFGRVSVNDDGTVVFSVNKTLTGGERLLVKTLKGTGYRDVECTVGSGLD